MSVISLRSVSKCFELHPDRPRSLQELFLRRIRREKINPTETLWAVRNVSLDIGAGETVGLIGSNGSGKSTCLKLMTRILTPTTGTVTVNGRISALLELGAGFHPELTGRENILLNGSVLGIPRHEMMKRFDEIVEFAELDRFIDVPVKVYSSGMYVRLGFATAISVDPEILLVDEVLAVGDQSFQDKCLDRIQRLKDRGVTIVIVSHDLDSVGELCDRVVWLNQGGMEADGPVAGVLESYLSWVYQHDHPDEVSERADEQDSQPGADAELEAEEPPVDQASDVETTDRVTEERLDQSADACAVAEVEDEPLLTPPIAVEPDPIPAPEPEPVGPQPERWGTGRATIDSVLLRAADGHVTKTLVTDEAAAIEIRYTAHELIDAPAFGVAIHNAQGVHISGCNTKLSKEPIAPIVGPGVVAYQIEALPLLPGEYLLSVAVHDIDETEAYDYMSLYIPFCVVEGVSCPHQGLVHIPATWRHESETDGSETR